MDPNECNEISMANSRACTAARREKGAAGLPKIAALRLAASQNGRHSLPAGAEALLACRAKHPQAGEGRLHHPQADKGPQPHPDLTQPPLGASASFSGRRFSRSSPLSPGPLAPPQPQLLARHPPPPPAGRDLKPAQPDGALTPPTRPDSLAVPRGEGDGGETQGAAHRHWCADLQFYWNSGPASPPPSPGKRKGTSDARLPTKVLWMRRMRVLRRLLRKCVASLCVRCNSCA